MVSAFFFFIFFHTSRNWISLLFTYLKISVNDSCSILFISKSRSLIRNLYLKTDLNVKYRQVICYKFCSGDSLFPLNNDVYRIYRALISTILRYVSDWLTVEYYHLLKIWFLFLCTRARISLDYSEDYSASSVLSHRLLFIRLFFYLLNHQINLNEM